MPEKRLPSDEEEEINSTARDGNQPMPSLPAIPYPEKWAEQVRLRDGLEVIIRPIHPDDAPRLQAGFKRLSNRTIYLRFMGFLAELTDNQAHKFANLDYHTRMAFVAALPQDNNFLIGVARYEVTHPEEPGIAEFAIVVEDEYQKRGLGTILLDRLIRYARTQGINSILAVVHTTNTPVMHFIKESGFSFRRKLLEPDILEVRVEIPQAK